MKLIVAIIRPENLAAVQKALNKRSIEQMTVTNVSGSGHERGRSYIYRSTIIEEKLLPRMKLEVAVDDLAVDSAVHAIQHSAETGLVGDGVIWVYPLEQVVRIGTVEEKCWLAGHRG